MSVKLMRLTLCLASLLWSAATVSAIAPVFTKIADTTTSVPGGTGTFSFFGSSSGGGLLAPAYDGEFLLFSGLDSQNKGGLYRWKAGTPLSMLVNTSNTVPGTAIDFNHFTSVSFSASPSSMDVYFLADSNTQTGVYSLGQSGQISTLATTNMNAPGTNYRLTGFSRPTSFGLYSGTYDTPSGVRSAIYSGFLGSFLNPRIGPNTPVPGGTGNFSSTAGPNSQIYFTFWGADANGNPGIYKLYSSFSSPPQWTIIADTNTTIPGTGLRFASFDSNSISASLTSIAFTAEDENHMTHVMQYMLSGSTPFLRRVSLDVGHYPVAAGSLYDMAWMGSRGGLYSNHRGNTQGQLIGPGDKLFGKTVESILIGPDAFVGANIAFAAKFTDGSGGIYIVNVPEPALLTVLLPLALFATRRRR